MKLTPGARYLLPSVILLLAATYALLTVNAPLWLSFLLIFFGFPAALALRVMYYDFRWKRAAAAAGARLPPRTLGNSLGNFDVSVKMMKIWENGYLGDFVSDQMSQFGPLIDLHILWSNIYITSSPQHIQLMLATDFNNFQKGPWFQKSMYSVLGTGVFNADGEMWKFHRSMSRPFFSRDRITHFDLYDRHSSTVISAIKSRFQEGYSIDFQDLFAKFTMDSATEFLFGSCVDSLKEPLAYPHGVVEKSFTPSGTNGFAESFRRAQEIVADRNHKGWRWPLHEIWRDATDEPMEGVRAVVEPIIHAALQKKQQMLEKNTEDIEEPYTLLDHLLNTTTDAKTIQDETLNILLAGRDTTAATLTMVTYFLSMYPETMARLRSEIMNTVGPERQPTFDDIKGMKFLRAVINETLRLYPVVPFNVREAIEATVLPADDPNDLPYYIPAGEGVAYSVFIMHRRKDLWGPDAEEFDPDRFLDSRLKQYLLPKPFIFLPFNAGPRICLGQQFAYNEISFMIIRLLQHFTSFTLDESAFPPECRPPAEWANCPGRKGVDRFCPRTTLTVYSAGGMWLKGTLVAGAEIEV